MGSDAHTATYLTSTRDFYTYKPSSNRQPLTTKRTFWQVKDMWDLWRSTWTSDGFIYENSGFSPSLTFHQNSILVYLTPNKSIYSKQVAPSSNKSLVFLTQRESNWHLDRIKDCPTKSLTGWPTYRLTGSVTHSVTHISTNTRPTTNSNGNTTQA